MAKVRFLIVLFFCVILVMTACSSPSNLQEATSGQPAEVQQTVSTDTLVAKTATSVPTATATEMPTEVPPTPTATFTPAPQSGTLLLSGQYGYGTGREFEQVNMRLSADGQRLIVPTSAGIFIFSPDDLSLLYSIHEPLMGVSNHVGISQDGNLAATYNELDTYDWVLRIWDLTNGEMINEYKIVSSEDLANITNLNESPIDNVGIVSITPDNQQAVVVLQNGLIWVVNLADGSIVKEIKDYMNNVESVKYLVFDPEGKYAYFIFRDVAFADQSVKLNAKTWTEESFKAASLQGVGAFSPIRSTSGFVFGYFPINDKGKKQSFVVAEDYSTLSERFVIKRGQDFVSALSFSPDGSKALMGGVVPPELELWAVDTLKTPEQTFAVPEGSSLWNVASSEKGELLFGITKNGTLYKWQNGQPQPVLSREGFWPIGKGLEFTEDGKDLRLFTDTTLTENNMVYELDASTGKLNGINPNPYILKDIKDQYPEGIALSPDRTLMAVIYNSWVDNAIRLFDFTTGKFLKKIPSKSDWDYIDFTPDGKSLIGYGRPDGPLEVMDLSTGKITRKFQFPEELKGNVREMKLSGDKATMVLLDWDGNLSAYQTDTFDPIQTPGEPTSASSIAVSNDGTRVALLTWEGKLRLWDIPNNILLPEIDLNESHDFDVFATAYLAFSPDGSQLAVVSGDGIIRVFDVAP